MSGIAFNATQVISTGTNPYAATCADFDGDGTQDVVVANSGLGEGMGLSLNNGNGTLAKQVRIAAFDAYAVASGDFNGDGRPDLAVGNIGGPGVLNVLINQGGGTFATRVPYAINSAPQSIVCADFNGDSRTDVAVTTLGGKGLNILLNNGDGTFAAAVEYAAPGAYYSVTAADFNADGRPDLAVPNISAGTVGVLRNNGDGTFAARVDYAVGTTPVSVSTGDYNGDGRPDLSVANNDGDSVSVLRNNGDGTFAAKMDYAMGYDAEVRSITSADFSGDGRLDLAVANELGAPVMLFRNNGDGTFARYGDYYDGMGITPVFIASADFDRDGHPDLAALSLHAATSPSGPGVLTVIRNRGDGTFSRNSWVQTGRTESQASGDFNGDGRPDLAVVIGGNSGGVLLNKGAGAFADKVSYAVGGPGTAAHSLTSADFDGDGWSDLAAAAYSSTGGSVLSVLRNTGNGTFAPKVDYPTSRGYYVTSADFNGDGRPDLAVVNSSTSDTLSVLMNKGDGTFLPRVDYSTGHGPSRLTAADFNGDGKTDLAVANYAANSVSVLRNKGDGTFAAKIDYPTNTAPVFVTSADVDGNGRPDLAVASQTGGGISLLRNNGNGTFATRVDYATGWGPSSLTAGDFDGDGFPDLAVSNLSDKTLTVLANRGDGTFSDGIDYTTGLGTSAYVVTTADFNGDGSPDLAVGDGSNYVITVPNKADFAPRALASTFSPTPHTITLAFSENVAPYLAAGDLLVTPLSGGQSISPSAVTFDPKTNTARFAFAAPLPDGDYRATIRAIDVSDSAGNSLPGDFVVDFFVLAGDANRDRVVNFSDLAILAQNYNQSNRTFAQGDFNGDGTVNFSDLAILAQRYNTTLPAPPPAPAALSPTLTSSQTLAAESRQSVFSTTPVARPVPAKPKPPPRAVRR